MLKDNPISSSAGDPVRVVLKGVAGAFLHMHGPKLPIHYA